MQRAVLFVLLAASSGCAGIPRRAVHAVAQRPPRPPDCEVAFYGPNRPPPRGLVELGRLPLTVGLYTPRSTVEKLIQPRACEAGALAVALTSDGLARSLGGGQRIKELEVILLAASSEDTVTETQAIVAGAALRTLSREAAAGLPADGR